jgi:hypothetical protein
MLRPAAKMAGGALLARQVTVETPAKRDDIDEQRALAKLAANISDGPVTGRNQPCGSSSLL